MRVDTAISAPPFVEDDSVPEGVTCAAWAALPVQTKVTCYLFDALASLDGLWLDLQTEGGNALRWLEPHLRAVSDDLERVLERMAS